MATNPGYPWPGANIGIKTRNELIKKANEKVTSSQPIGIRETSNGKHFYLTREFKKRWYRLMTQAEIDQAINDGLIPTSETAGIQRRQATDCNGAGSIDEYADSAWSVRCATNCCDQQVRERMEEPVRVFFPTAKGDGACCQDFKFCGWPNWESGQVESNWDGQCSDFQGFRCIEITAAKDPGCCIYLGSIKTFADDFDPCTPITGQQGVFVFSEGILEVGDVVLAYQIETNATCDTYPGECYPLFAEECKVTASNEMKCIQVTGPFQDCLYDAKLVPISAFDDDGACTPDLTGAQDILAYLPNVSTDCSGGGLTYPFFAWGMLVGTYTGTNESIYLSKTMGKSEQKTRVCARVSSTKIDACCVYEAEYKSYACPFDPCNDAPDSVRIWLYSEDALSVGDTVNAVKIAQELTCEPTPGSPETFELFGAECKPSSTASCVRKSTAVNNWCRDDLNGHTIEVTDPDGGSNLTVKFCGCPGHPNVCAGEEVCFMCDEEGGYVAVGDYCDDPIGTVRMQAITGAPKGWEPMNGAANAIGKPKSGCTGPGTGINMMGLFPMASMAPDPGPFGRTDNVISEDELNHSHDICVGTTGLGGSLVDCSNIEAANGFMVTQANLVQRKCTQGTYLPADNGCPPAANSCPPGQAYPGVDGDCSSEPWGPLDITPGNARLLFIERIDNSCA